MTRPQTSKTLLIADYLSDLWIRMVVRNGAATERALRKMRAGEYGFNGYLQSVTELVDGNLFDGVELAESIAAGPGFTVASNVARSTHYPVPYTDCQSRVTLTSPLTRGFGDELSKERVSFESVQGDEAKHSPSGVLETGAQHFRLVVDRTDLQSGSYAATAEVTPLATDADDADKRTLDVTIEL